MDSIVPYLILSFMGFTRSVDSVKIDYWKPWTPKSVLPKDAVAGGKNRYVGRVTTANGQITAMIGLKKKVAVAIQNKKSIYTSGIEILCTKQPKKLYWEPILDWNNVPKNTLENAFIAGFQKDISSYLYVGRAKQPNLYKIGKVIAPKKKGSGLWIWQDEKPLQFTKFELLRSNNTK